LEDYEKNLDSVFLLNVPKTNTEVDHALQNKYVISTS